MRNERQCRLAPSRRSRGRILSLSLPSRNRVRRLAEGQAHPCSTRGGVNESLSDRTGGLPEPGLLVEYDLPTP
jgi:hypothetical protein